MDLWVVATAAGAGYLVRYWKKLLKDGNSSSQLSSRNSNFEEPGSPDHPFSRTAQRKNASEGILADNGDVLNGRSSVMSQSASTGGFDFEKLENFGNYQDSNGLTLTTSNLPQSQKSTFSRNMDDSESDLLPCSSSRELNYFRLPLRKTGSFRSKHSYGRFIRPLSSLESCVMSHLCKEHVEMEEYILHSLQSPTTSTRRLIINDGTQRISNAVSDSFSVQVDTDASNFHKEAFFEKNRNVYGIPLLPKIQSLNTSEIINIKAGRKRGGGVNSTSQMYNENFLHAKGLPDRMILFCLGISIGLISSLMENKCEIAKLKELLKHTENLVQDLQEELEMKDSLTVKELSNENCESQDMSENSLCRGTTNVLLAEQNVDSSAKFDGKEVFEHKAEESSESISKIEAELEAELQRLALNIDTSNMDGKFSDLHELDPEFTRDFSEGELRANMINGQSATRLHHNQDASEITCSGNYAVSPRELSLRLHEVIQSRLEARVRELETALQNSERKLKHIETKHNNSWNEFIQSELQDSSGEDSPIVKPLVMNLSGEALDAYNEAYEELTNMDDSEEELMHSSPSRVNESKHQQSQIAISGYPFAIPKGRTNGSSSFELTIDEEKNARHDFRNSISTMEGHCLLGQQSNDVNTNGDESSDYDDEMEKQLIRQIVEKTRKGSPVVLNAQRWLFSMDKDG